MNDQDSSKAIRFLNWNLANLLVALGGVAAAVAALFVAFQIGKSESEVAKQDLTLSAYGNAVHEILDFKAFFLEHPTVFENQIRDDPSLSQYIPPHMDTETFLAFSGGMWRFSYVYSVMSRPAEFGLREQETSGLKKELLLWLQDVPGFYDVYCWQTRVTQAHNPDFLNFLREEVYNNEFLARIGAQALCEQTIPR